MGERNFHLHGNSFNRRAIGTEYETLAGEYLTRHGYQILCRNFHCRQGEIDIIARDRDYLVFIEVKYRRDEHEGDPAEAVACPQAGADSSYRPVLYDALSYFRGHAVPV